MLRALLLAALLALCAQAQDTTNKGPELVVRDNTVVVRVAAGKTVQVGGCG